MVVRHVTEDEPIEESEADLLTDWRVAERDVIAAKAIQVIAEHALAAAEAAEEAARAVEAAAEAVNEAAMRARAAAEQARKSARHASEETQMQTATAQGNKARADQAVDVAVRAEAETHERFRESKNGEMDERRWAPSEWSELPNRRAA